MRPKQRLDPSHDWTFFLLRDFCGHQRVVQSNVEEFLSVAPPYRSNPPFTETCHLPAPLGKWAHNSTLLNAVSLARAMLVDSSLQRQLSSRRGRAFLT
jgi:hypothetical protein